MVEKLLEIEGLCVDFLHENGYTPAVKNVSYEVFRGRTLGIVGESGSGKSVSTMSIMRLLPVPPARISAGAIRFWPKNSQDPVNLLSLSEDEVRHYRGSRISMIFQEPMTSLNPVQKCGAQVVEMLLQHEKVSPQEARSRALELFNEVMLPRPEKIFDSYPHEISGGQKQRVMIAMALICHPELVIADEPTTALDVTVQRAIIDLLRTLQQKYNIGIIFITHDLGVVAQIADDVAVMYKGEIVEHGTARQVLYHPQHPYTQGLLACRPPLDSRPLRLPTVKDFLEGTHAPAAHEAPLPPSEASKQVLLRVRDLEVTYPLKKNILGKTTQQLKAVDGLSFDIYRGETLGLVGESGCGKSTLGRAILRLLDTSAGTVEYDGVKLGDMSASSRKSLRRKMQIVFQDPYSSLNPRITIGEAILEPLRVHGMKGEGDADPRQRVLDLMRKVDLDVNWYDRYPHELSGGQRQRVCIARALILNPELVVCDESVSALDVSVQAQVLNLLNDLKREYGYTYLFITHDLSVVKFLSDRIMVMEKGRLVECGTADEVYAHPQHPYTQKLISALPKLSSEN